MFCHWAIIYPVECVTPFLFPQFFRGFRFFPFVFLCWDASRCRSYISQILVCIPLFDFYFKYWRFSEKWLCGSILEWEKSFDIRPLYFKTLIADKWKGWKKGFRQAVKGLKSRPLVAYKPKTFKRKKKRKISRNQSSWKVCQSCSIRFHAGVPQGTIGGPLSVWCKHGWWGDKGML